MVVGNQESTESASKSPSLLNGHSRTASNCNSTKHVFAVSSASPPQKTRSRCQKITLFLCISGFLFIVAAFICSFIMIPIVESQILANLPIIDGSEFFYNWKDPPVHPMMYMRFFNLTNKEAFLAGKEKPNLEEVGPYTYRLNMAKTNVEFHEGGEEVSYMASRSYFFVPEESSGPDSDIIVMPNIPLFGAMKKMASEVNLAKTVFRNLLDGYAGLGGVDLEPFVTVSVREYLWSYKSILLSLDYHMSEECNPTVSPLEDFESEKWNNDNWDDDDWDNWGNDNDIFKANESPQNHKCDITEGNLKPFGLFIGRNNSILDRRTIKTGKSDVSIKGLMVRWHDMEKVNYWNDVDQYPNCNAVNGNDPGDLPMNINKDDVISAFVGPLCRKLNFKYVREVNTSGFHTLQFTPDTKSFDSPSSEPANSCYCLSEPCLPSGLSILDGCQPGAPIYMSWPHFLHGDPALHDGVDGLDPDPEKHSFIINIEPKYGIPLVALAKLQMNVIIEKNGGFGYFDNINQDKIYYPFTWLEEGIPGPSEPMVDNIEFLLGLPAFIKTLMSFLMLSIGLIMLVPELVNWVNTCTRDRKQSYIHSTIVLAQP